jgi:hypothetical protein
MPSSASRVLCSVLVGKAAAALAARPKPYVRIRYDSTCPPKSGRIGLSFSRGVFVTSRFASPVDCTSVPALRPGASHNQVRYR